MNLIPDRFQHAAKGVVAAIGAGAALVLQLVAALAPGLPDAFAPVSTVVVAVATFVGVYLVPNLQKILDADPVNEPTAPEPATTDEPTDGTGVIIDPAVTNPSPDFTPDVDGADDLTATDDGTDVVHDGSVG